MCLKRLGKLPEKSLLLQLINKYQKNEKDNTALKYQI